MCRSVSGVSVSRVKTKQKMRRVFNNINSGDAVSRVRKTNPRLFIKRLVFTNKRRRGNSVFKVFDSRVAVTRVGKKLCIAYLNVAVMPFQSFLKKEAYCTVAY